MSKSGNNLREIFQMLHQASEAILAVYNSSGFDVNLKSDNSPVTSADKASSAIINNTLQNLFPQVPVLDEEIKDPGYDIRKQWDQYFLIDPMDGTKEFLKRNGEFCVNLARIEDQQPKEGWIYKPLDHIGWYCKRGDGIYRFNKSGIVEKVPGIDSDADTIRIVTSRSHSSPLEKRLIDQMAKKWPVEMVHMGSSLKQIELILGNASMYLKAGPCSEWDTAPGQLMVEESGGAVLTLDTFEPMVYNKKNLRNPHFVMLGKPLNNSSFIAYLQGLIQNN